MKYGASLPLTAASDNTALRDFVEALDGGGFDLLTVAGHVLSVPAERFSDRPAATYDGPFHDPFVVFAYLAAITQRLHFRPSILILPLFPTALIAKQAAELQQLSDGRFELGVGISWNTAEYQALNQNFRTRGRRVEEQIDVLRRMWSEPYVNFEGRFHALDGVGLNRVLKTPIPIWMGSGTTDVVLRRVAKLADGWVPLGDPTQAMPLLRQYLSEVGRDPSSFGLTGRVIAGPEGWIESAKKLQSLGATHLTLGVPPAVQGPAIAQRLLEAKRVLAAELGATAEAFKD